MQQARVCIPPQSLQSRVGWIQPLCIHLRLPARRNYLCPTRRYMCTSYIYMPLSLCVCDSLFASPCLPLLGSLSLSVYLSLYLFVSLSISLSLSFLLSPSHHVCVHVQVLRLGRAAMSRWRRSSRMRSGRRLISSPSSLLTHLSMLITPPQADHAPQMSSQWVRPFPRLDPHPHNITSMYDSYSGHVCMQGAHHAARPCPR